MKQRVLAVLSLILGVLPAFAQDDVTFDLSEIRKKPTTLGGYFEVRPGLAAPDRGSPIYVLRNYGRWPSSPMLSVSSVMQPELKHERGPLTVFARTNTTFAHAYSGWSTSTRVYESHVSYRPSQKLAIDLGKKTLKWGKGYAWNPAAFLDRPKDPEDPELALEGVTLAGAEYTTTSTGGPVRTVTLTPMVLPVLSGLNDRLGVAGKQLVAVKVYALISDTDLDLILVEGGGRGARVGMDFSRNVGASFELHGEWGRDSRSTRRIVDASGGVRSAENASSAYLLGLRFITRDEITVIAEYYRNEGGYSAQEMRDFQTFVLDGLATFEATGDDAKLRQAGGLADAGYGRPNAGRSYLYVRASRPDSFGVLQLTPAVMFTMNLADGSFALTQEAVYKAQDRLELRAQLSWISGSRSSDFGARANDLRADLRARWYL